MSRPSRVRSVRYRTIGSRTRIWDEWRVPFALYHGARVGRWMVKHPKSSAGGATFLFLWRSTGLLATVLLVGVLGLLGLTGWVAWRSRRPEGPAGIPRLSVEDVKLRTQLRRQWRLSCRAAKLQGAESGEPPKLEREASLPGGSIRAVVKCGEIGIPTASVQKAVVTLADVIGCREVIATPLSPGKVELTFHWRDPIGRVLPLADLPIAPTGRIAYGIRQDNSVATVIPTQSILIGGLTRKGKSNAIWALLADCIRQGLFVDLYVSDPKGGIELDALERVVGATGGLVRVRQYAHDLKSTAEMVVNAEKAMHARQYEQKQKGLGRQVTPDQDNPLVVIILDEVLLLQEMLKKGPDSPLARIAFTGAASAYVVWANTQAAQIDVIGRFRDFVPQRICFATSQPEVTDSILGRGSEGMGATCSEINEPGVGFSHSEGDKIARKFRCALVTDDEVKYIARGELPTKVRNAAREAYDRRAEAEDAGTASKSRKDRPTKVYRWYYDGDPEYGDSLGYVGISYDVLIRESQHDADLRRFMEGNNRRTVETYPNRAAALAAEEEAIKLEKPIHNRQHNGGNAKAEPDEKRPRRFRRQHDRAA